MTDANEFSGEVAVVTAAAGLGIGQATACRLAAGGANVVVTDIHPGRTEKVAQSMREDYPDAHVLGIPLDAGDRCQIDLHAGRCGHRRSRRQDRGAGLRVHQARTGQGGTDARRGAPTPFGGRAGEIQVAGGDLRHRDDFPRTPAGKVRKTEARAVWAARRELSKEGT